MPKKKPNLILFGVDSLRAAIARAYEAVEQVRFEGVYYRKDIGHRALKRQ